MKLLVANNNLQSAERVCHDLEREEADQWQKIKDRISDSVKAWLDDRCVFGGQYETDKEARSDFIDYCWDKRLNRLENKCAR